MSERFPAGRIRRFDEGLDVGGEREGKTLTNWERVSSLLLKIVLMFFSPATFF